jgi:hypothetical protein
MDVFPLLLGLVVGGAGLMTDEEAPVPAASKASSAAAPLKVAQRPMSVRIGGPAAGAPGNSAESATSTGGQTGESAAAASSNYRIRDEFGQCVVGRLHGQSGDKTTLILPDGQLGIPSLLVPTDQPFVPVSLPKLAGRLRNGPFSQFQLFQTAHYIVLYQSSRAFAEDSARLLEDLYKGLIDAFGRNGIAVHDSEFPLVAVIFATEQDFQAHKRVDPQVRAYYEFFTNRIFFYEKSKNDHLEPKLAALLKPQTVAHEGAHQILSNIGVQPRLSGWPAWLVEGLAEYCATSSTGPRKPIAWQGMGAINALHMATIRELSDPLSIRVSDSQSHSARFASQRSAAMAESLILETDLSTTDYALAWAMTHYLARKRGPEFFEFLKVMSQLPPMVRQTPQQHLSLFREFFGGDLARLDKKIDAYIRKLSEKRTYDPLPFYAVLFEQALPNGALNRAVMVSQSPQIIEQWVNDRTSSHGDIPNWVGIPLSTRARADLTAMRFMRGESD